jgi:hypothetical protein
MWLWRHPLAVFGENKFPYVPRGLMHMLGLADRLMRLGPPWNLAVLARRAN